VVALAGLVVIAQHATAIHDQDQAVFVLVVAAPYRLWNLSDFQFDERGGGQSAADVMDSDGWHVVILETPRVLSI